MFLNSLTAKAAMVVFILFFLFGLLLWLKNWFEINKFNKLEKIKKDLAFLSSPFYLNRMTELKNLSLKNHEYNVIFFYFLEQYKSYFAKDLDLLFLDFLKIFSKQENFKNFLVEPEHLTMFLKKYHFLKTKIEFFSDELRVFSSWESFCLSKINEFNMVLDKIYEEIEIMKITFSFNFSEFDKYFNEMQHNIVQFEHLIYQKNDSKTFSFFRELENKIAIFLSESYTWIKIINVFLVFLPKKRKKINDLLLDNVLKNNLLNTLQQETIRLENFLLNWEINSAKGLLLFLLKDLDNQIYQLENKHTLSTVFKNTWMTSATDFLKIKKNIFDLLRFSKNFNKQYFFQRFEEAGFENFNDLVKKTEKIYDDLFVQNHNIKKITFFKPLLKKTEIFLNSLIILFDIYRKMKYFFNRESEQIEQIILTLFNLNTLFSKEKNFFLKNLYQKKLENCISFLINFEQKKYKSEYNLNYTALLGSLQNQILNLKINIQNTMLLKKIAELLFIKANRLRFKNSENWNKILNCEILFLKQEYKNVIEILLETVE